MITDTTQIANLSEYRYNDNSCVFLPKIICYTSCSVFVLSFVAGVDIWAHTPVLFEGLVRLGQQRNCPDGVMGPAAIATCPNRQSNSQK